MDIVRDSSLGLAISNLVVNAYTSKCPRTGKPSIRSNGVEEWTILAGVVAIMPQQAHTSSEPLQLVSLATGSKAVPDSMRPYSKGRMVHDLHSEMLALRALNYHLLHECVKLKLGRTSSLVETNPDSVTNKAFRIKEGMRFALFITEPPCGDASMGYLAQSEKFDGMKKTERDERVKGLLSVSYLTNPTSKSNSTEASPTVYENEPPLKRAKMSVPGVVRGRDGYYHLGTVRTKPGRADSPISLSKSCLDKLTLKQFTSFLNCINSLILSSDRAHLSYLVLAEDKFTEVDMTRCFRERFEADCTPFSLLTYKDSGTFPHGKPDINGPKMVPSPLSLVYIPSTDLVEVLNGGVKQGCNLNANKTMKLFTQTGCGVKRGGESALSNYRMFSEAVSRGLISLGGSYNGWKKSHTQREELKKRSRGYLGEWVATQVDDFVVV
ncbi:hypothetical protein BABINDRAFT_159226 [Babjeviella inositovora NRRL Y-12698]|uniref:A to I editase domain-containing protein n=1 Tax=Babjeviella inositovora NRRL Y-12698 TaxID=984486 RepID=A0A1E3QYK7_9ASCO|nr:uncharacterized protein BABINDRAFT_159226 [Babjeviella inositovora NRRL Y-12698]ODQ82701.1 hypothetical protein BABINDRAFT_159226 [Babjeviella inositovora NRRL Y-12698]